MLHESMRDLSLRPTVTAMQKAQVAVCQDAHVFWFREDRNRNVLNAFSHSWYPDGTENHRKRTSMIIRIQRMGAAAKSCSACITTLTSCQRAATKTPFRFRWHGSGTVIVTRPSSRTRISLTGRRHRPPHRQAVPAARPRRVHESGKTQKRGGDYRSSNWRLAAIQLAARSYPKPLRNSWRQVLPLAASVLVIRAGLPSRPGTS
jgi:hypothetical protein